MHQGLLSLWLGGLALIKLNECEWKGQLGFWGLSDCLKTWRVFILFLFFNLSITILNRVKKTQLIGQQRSYQCTRCVQVVCRWVVATKTYNTTTSYHTNSTKPIQFKCWCRAWTHLERVSFYIYIVCMQNIQFNHIKYMYNHSKWYLDILH